MYIYISFIKSKALFLMYRVMVEIEFFCSTISISLLTILRP